MQLAAAEDVIRVRGRRFLHAQGDVGLQLLEQALAQIARGHELAFLARERPVVGDELHLHRRLFDLEEGQDDGTGDVGDGFADGQILHARDGADVASHGFQKLEALERLVAKDLGHAEFLALAVAVDAKHAFALAHSARLHAPDGDVAEVVVVVERGHVHGQRSFHVSSRRRHGVEDEVEQRREILLLVGQMAHGIALAA